MISVIVPVYNIASYISRCVESIVDQSYKDLQIILVDDGSTDGSGDICDDWVAKNQRIQAIHKSNGGVSSARNAGLDVVKGEYVSFIDGDDWLEPNMYEVMLEDMEKNKCEAVFCGVYYAKSVDDKLEISPTKNGPVSVNEALANMLGLDGDINYQFAAWNKLFRRDIVGENRFDQELTYGEDGLFSICALKGCNSVFFEPKPFYNYYLRDDSATHTSGVTRQRLDKARAWEKIGKELEFDLSLKAASDLFLAEYALEMTVEAYIGNQKEFGEMRSLLGLAWDTWQSSEKISYLSKLKYKMILKCIDAKAKPSIVSRLYGAKS